MLGNAHLMAFIPVRDIDRAQAFYVDRLDLELEEKSPFALVVRAGATTLRITPVGSFTPQPFTVLGWEVAGIRAVARQMVGAGIEFERYPGMEQDDIGVWTAPDGSKVMWFKDPDGNTLSLTEDVNADTGFHRPPGDLPA